MKTIVIYRTGDRADESSIARAICEIVEDTAVVTVGCGGTAPSPGGRSYPRGTSWNSIETGSGDKAFLVIVSDGEIGGIIPDCSIVPGGNPRGTAAPAHFQNADFTGGGPADPGAVERCSDRLLISREKVRRLAWLSGCRPEPVTALILAGGKSSRIRSDKAFLKVDGERLIDRIARQLGPSVDAVTIVTSADKADRYPDYTVAVDEMPGEGPLRGIVSGLAQSGTELNFVVACDVPDVDSGTLRGLLSWSGEFDIVVPSLREGQTEPLFAVYRKSLLPAARMLLNGGERRVASLYPFCRTKTVFLPQAAWFANINTRDDYERYVEKQKDS